MPDVARVSMLLKNCDDTHPQIRSDHARHFTIPPRVERRRPRAFGSGFRRDRKIGAATTRRCRRHHTFRLKAHPRKQANAEYIVLVAHFEIENVSEDTTRQADLPDISNGVSFFKSVTRALNDAQRQLGRWQVKTCFEVQPATEALRPQILQKKPRVYGTEVARVTGPSSDTAQGNLYTDQYGRIKVQFPWDRYGQNDQNSSCWVRVVSP